MKWPPNGYFRRFKNTAEPRETAGAHGSQCTTERLPGKPCGHARFCVRAYDLHLLTLGFLRGLFSMWFLGPGSELTFTGFWNIEKDRKSVSRSF